MVAGWQDMLVLLCLITGDKDLLGICNKQVHKHAGTCSSIMTGYKDMPSLEVLQ